MSVLTKAVRLAAAACALALPVSAEITVELNKTKPLSLAGEPGSVVIGNPDVADVAVTNNNRLFITGKSFGTTNLIIYDVEGRQIFSSDVLVTTTATNLVKVARAGETIVMDCAPNCATRVDNRR